MNILRRSAPPVQSVANDPGQGSRRRIGYRLDGPAILCGVRDYIDALAVDDVEQQAEAVARLRGLGLTLIVAHDAAGEMAR